MATTVTQCLLEHQGHLNNGTPDHVPSFKLSPLCHKDYQNASQTWEAQRPTSLQLAPLGKELLTELLGPGGWLSQNDPPDEELQVVEEDEGWRGRRPAMILLNEVMALELPDLVGVCLHLLKRVAGRGKAEGLSVVWPEGWKRSKKRRVHAILEARETQACTTVPVWLSTTPCTRMLRLWA